VLNSLTLQLKAVFFSRLCLGRTTTNNKIFKNTKLKGAANLMNTPPRLECFSAGAKENAGIAALYRGFLTRPGGKKSVLA
jgi:hypothetical protein